jgi:site-specific recombinase XerD
VTTIQPSLASILDAYLRERGASDWTKRSLAHGRSILGRFTAFIARRGHKRWASVTGEDCQAFLMALANDGLSYRTRDHYSWDVKGFGAWLLARGHTLRDPTAGLRVMEDDEMPLPPAPLTEQQVATLFAALPRGSVVDLRNRLHLELLYACALRNHEAVALDVRDIDLDARAVHVRIAKGGVPRVLPIMPAVLVAAQEYLSLRRELLRGPDCGALLLMTTGKRLQPWYMQRFLAGASRSIGFRVHPHLLRHSIAVHLMRQRVDVRHIQQLLGHARLDTTKVYLRLVPGHLKEDYLKAMPVFPIDVMPPINPPGNAGHSTQGTTHE